MTKHSTAYYFLLILSLFWSVISDAQSTQQADSLTQLEKYKPANEIYTQLWQQEKQVITRFELQLKIAINEQRLKQYDAATERLQQLLKKKTWQTIPDSLQGLAYHKLGVSAYGQQQYEKAVEYYDQAIEIRRRILPAAHPDIIRGHNNIAGCFRQLERTSAELTQYERIIESVKPSDENSLLFLARAYFRKGGILAQRGDIRQANDYILSGVTLTETYLDDDFYALAEAYNEAMSYHYELDEGEKMVEYAQKTLELYTSLEEEDRYEEDEYEIANAYNNLAIGYELMEDYGRAIEYYLKSIAINEEYISVRRSFLSDNYNNLADLYRKNEQLDLAIATIQQALATEKQLSRPISLANIYYNRGEIFFEQYKYEKALADYQKALQIYVPAFQENDFFTNPNTSAALKGGRLFLVDILADKAAILRYIGLQKSDTTFLANALATYDTAAVLIDQIRLSFQSDESKFFLATRAQSVYQEALKLCFDLDAKTEDNSYQKRAFEYAERSKALALLEAVREADFKRNVALDPAILEQEKELKQQINELEQQLFEQSEEEQTIRFQLLIKQRELGDLIQQLERKYPAYHQLNYQLALPSVAELQQELGEEEGILEYVLVEDEIYGETLYWFYIGKGEFKSGQQELYEPTISGGIDGFRYALTQYEEQEVDPAYAAIGYFLYQALIEPIEQKVKLAKRLRIIPDGIINYLPFDALPTQKIEEEALKNYSQYPYLHHNYQISYNYSAALWQEMNRLEHRARNQQLLAFAPVFQSRQGLSLGNTKVNLPPLLRNVQSTENILQQFKGKFYAKSKARKAQFLKKAENYAFLHLATHAQLNDENANYSFISFAQTQDSIQKEELLFLNELYSLNLNADMVVLSACETGVGELKKGEGIISLARAFAYAGAKSMVTSLWQVSDQKTGDLMTFFYENLSQELPKDEALHQAKQQLIERNLHPYYWAGFVVIGDVEAVEVATFPWLLLSVILLGVISVIALLLRLPAIKQISH